MALDKARRVMSTNTDGKKAQLKGGLAIRRKDDGVLGLMMGLLM